MKQILSKLMSGALAAIGLVLLLCEAPGNAVLFVATKIVGAAFLYASTILLKKYHPEIMEEDV